MKLFGKGQTDEPETRSLAKCSPCQQGAGQIYSQPQADVPPADSAFSPIYRYAGLAEPALTGNDPQAAATAEPERDAVAQFGQNQLQRRQVAQDVELDRSSQSAQCEKSPPSACLARWPA